MPESTNMIIFTKMLIIEVLERPGAAKLRKTTKMFLAIDSTVKTCNTIVTTAPTLSLVIFLVDGGFYAFIDLS